MYPKSKAEYKRLVVEPSERLLENGIPGKCSSAGHSHGAICRFRSTWSTSAITMHLSLILLYTLVTVLVLTKGFHKAQQRLTVDNSEAIYYSPAREAMALHSYIPPEPGMSNAGYTGNPSPEVDQAWNNLLRGYNMRISQETLVRLNRSSIALADGSGDYWGSLEVFHHLHCLKIIRQYMGIDYYDANKVRIADKPPGNVYPTHIEHCIEALREYLMCVPDLTIYTHDWVDGRDDEPMPNHAVKHACVNWSELEGWVEERRFSLADKFIRRVDGTVWPDGLE